MPAPKGHPPYAGSERGGVPKIHTKQFIEREADAFSLWMKQSDNVYFKDFALERGYHPQRLCEFAKQNEKFAEAYSRAQAWQESKLVKGGLTSVFNAGFCKFVMGNVCGWTDRQQTQVTGDAANPLAFILRNIDGKSKDLVE